MELFLLFNLLTSIEYTLLMIGIFVVMALVWAWIFQGTKPDMFDVIGASISLLGVAIIFYIPRKNEVMWREGK
jgi:drug/metabolite transporter (DMT)-like permease